MSQSDLKFDVADLPLDVFELVDDGLEIESLTAGHGMLENGASSTTISCSLSCSCGCCPQDPYGVGG